MARSEFARKSAIISRLGTVPDREIAEEYGVSIRAVGLWRKMHGIPAYLVERAWTNREISILGTMPDAAVARATSRTPRAVKAKRQKLGIAGFTRPRSDYYDTLKAIADEP
jgi:hypothetical protein